MLVLWIFFCFLNSYLPVDFSSWLLHKWDEILHKEQRKREMFDCMYTLMYIRWSFKFSLRQIIRRGSKGVRNGERKEEKKSTKKTINKQEKEQHHSVWTLLQQMDQWYLLQNFSFFFFSSVFWGLLQLAFNGVGIIFLSLFPFSRYIRRMTQSIPATSLRCFLNR